MNPGYMGYGRTEVWCFAHSGCWIVLGMRGQKDCNGLLLGGCWLSSIWMKSLGMTRKVFRLLFWGPFCYIGR